jgi:protoheme IX farnesyltransferase
VREYLALTKPRITVMAVLVAAGAGLLAPGAVGAGTLLAALLGIALAVGAANALNQHAEREGDALMERTRERPLPAGRLAPRAALLFGLALAGVGLPLLLLAVNALTAGLAALALVNYVAVYTPLKRRTTLSLQVGAVSGAMPALMGWTAVTGALDAAGLLLFAVLWLWQMPHFLAIALYRKEEYARAGIRIVPLERGDLVARRQCLAYATALLPLSLALVLWGGAGAAYAVVAVLVNAGFIAHGLQGLRPGAGHRWARGFFAASLVYPLALIGGLLLDAALR